MREHLSEKIRNWVDTNSKDYPEMQYFMEGDNYCERVDLFDIFLNENIDISQKQKRILLISVGGTVVQSKDKDGITVISNDMEHYKILQDLKREASKAFSSCNDARMPTPEIDVLPLLNKDSSNIVPSDWDVLINAIVNNYDKFDSFIVLHGTNTMGYTCAALSFALENLGKLVVFTGAQIPYGNPGSDALQNVENAIQLAIQQNHEIYGVVAVFGDNIIPGMRVKKTISSGYDAFKTFGTHNDLIIGKTVGMQLNCTAVERLKSFCMNPAKSAEELTANTKKAFEFNQIVSLTEFPGMSPNVFIEHVEKGDAKGFILRASGTGDPNVSDEDSQTLRVAFEYLREKKIPIIITTQTLPGFVCLA